MPCLAMHVSRNHHPKSRVMRPIGLRSFAWGGIVNLGTLTQPCLAATLQRSGWNAFGVTSLGVLDSNFGFDRGFDLYRDDLGDRYQADAAAVNEKVFEWLKDEPENPFFAFVHYSDPHEPYFSHGARETVVRISSEGEIIARIDIAEDHYLSLPLDLPTGKTELRFECERDFRLRGSWISPREAPVQIVPGPGWREDEADSLAAKDGRVVLVNRKEDSVSIELKLYLTEILSLEEIRSSYAAEVEYADRAIGELLAAFRDRGLLEHTWVILSADHGEGLGDHGEIGHITQLYDSMIHVPLIFHHPDRIPSGETVEAPVGWVELFPTILEILSLDQPPGLTGAPTITSTLPMAQIAAASSPRVARAAALEP